MTTLWDLLRRKFPKEVHLRVKRYSMEEVLQDSNWLIKKWAEKDRILSHFARHQVFPSDNRGYCQHRIFDTRSFALESSIVALIRLLLLPCAVPVLLLLSVPVFWTLLAVWLGQRAYQVIFQVPPEPANPDDSRPDSVDSAGQRTPGSASAAGTPFFPATPFASPSLLNWRDMFSPNDDNNNGGTR
jgi:Acyltransferase C-terminus